MKRTLFAVGLALFGAVGCGGGGGGGGGTTYTLASAALVQVPAVACQLVAGPAPVGTGTMFYEIDDLAPGTDEIESIIIANSFYYTYGCNFDASTEAVTDDTFTGSHQNSGQVLADSYDVIVICHNASNLCQFNLTWTATY
ncbi:MAG TPA: hypothetical protein VI456_08770 [Polyangia bacterium]